MNSEFYRRGFALVTIALLGIAAWRIFEPFFGALAWAACLALLLSPVQDWATRRLHGRNGRAAGIVTVLTPIVLLAPLAMLGVAFANQVATLVTRIQGLSLNFNSGLLAQLERIPFVGRLVSWISENIPITTEQIEAGLLQAAQSTLRNLASASGNIVLGAVGTIVGFFLMLVLLFFLLRDGAALLDRAVRLIPLEKQKRERLVQLVGNTVRAVVIGSGLTALAQGAMVGIAFAIVGLPSPIVFGVLTAVAALLPAGGSGLVWVPALLYLGATGRWGAAIFMLIWGLIVSVSDNVLRPMLISKGAPVSTLVVFIGVIGGVSAFGAVGLIIGPVLLVLIAALLKFGDELADDALAQNEVAIADPPSAPPPAISVAQSSTSAAAAATAAAQGAPDSRS